MDELLITIHGIQSSGDWHDRVKAALEPHFRCEKVAYRGYRWFGPLFFAALPIGLVIILLYVGAMPLGLLSLADVRFSPLAWSGAVLILIGFALPVWTLYKVKAQIATLTEDYVGRPHLIAHSFGTCLSCWALHDFDHIRFSRMILVGCVLPRDFPWRAVLDHKPKALLDVRNEVGTHDWVVGLTPFVQLVDHRVGPAGKKGFTPQIGLVHDRLTWISCQPCPADPDARVHNLQLKEGTHWIKLFETGHPRDIWLPYLWGYEPAEFETHIQLCNEGYDAIKDGHDRRARQVEKTYRDEVWTWTEKKRCEDFLGDVLIHYYNLKHLPIPSTAELMEKQREAIHWIWISTMVAFDEWRKPAGTKNDKVVRQLKPGWLFEEAVKKVVT